MFIGIYLAAEKDIDQQAKALRYTFKASSPTSIIVIAVSNSIFSVFA